MNKDKILQLFIDNYEVIPSQGVILHKKIQKFMPWIKIGDRAGCLIKSDKSRSDKYRRITLSFEGSRYAAMEHQVIFYAEHGFCPKVIDHINRDKGDNRISNLRESCSLTNKWNRGVSITNKSGTNGVSWDKPRKKWRASICCNNKRINIGRFKDKNEAIIARKKAEEKYWALQD